LLSHPFDRWFVYKRLVPAKAQCDDIPLLNQEVNLCHLFLKSYEDRPLGSLDRQEKTLSLSLFPHDLSVDGCRFVYAKRFRQIGTGHIRRENSPNHSHRNPNQKDEKDQPSVHDTPPSPESLFMPPLGTSDSTPSAAR
jgi:hypothetical protein